MLVLSPTRHGSLHYQGIVLNKDIPLVHWHMDHYCTLKEWKDIPLHENVQHHGYTPSCRHKCKQKDENVGFIAGLAQF